MRIVLAAFMVMLMTSCLARLEQRVVSLELIAEANRDAVGGLREEFVKSMDAMGKRIDGVELAILAMNGRRSVAEVGRSVALHWALAGRMWTPKARTLSSMLAFVNGKGPPVERREPGFKLASKSRALLPWSAEGSPMAINDALVYETDAGRIAHVRLRWSPGDGEPPVDLDLHSVHLGWFNLEATLDIENEESQASKAFRVRLQARVQNDRIAVDVVPEDASRMPLPGWLNKAIRS